LPVLVISRRVDSLSASCGVGPSALSNPEGSFTIGNAGEKGKL